MNKKSFLSATVLSLLMFLLFSACSNGSSIDLSSGSEENLKQIAAKRESSLLWTRELESIRLTREINTVSAVSSNLKLSPEVIIVSSSDRTPLFPVLDSFGSLDTTGITSDLKTFLDGFSESVIKWKLEISMMNQASAFSLILFKNDVESAWKEKMGIPFLVTEELPLFTSKIYGEPTFIGDEIIVPVRFECKSGSLDIRLHIDSSDQFKIGQIVILRWGKQK